MHNLTKIQGGFVYNNQMFMFTEIEGIDYEILNPFQFHIYTDLGIILFDLDCLIDGVKYDSIIDCINALINF